jgi:predicted TIM-barrel fold metal-dependent hydrolase
VKLFSVDDHIVEPRDVWSKRVPARYRDVAPHVVEEDGNEYWIVEGVRHPTLGLNAVAGKPVEQWDLEPTRFSDMIPGCYDPHERAKDMAREGIVASINFPSLPRFGGALFPGFQDKELAAVCVRAWNDFMFEEWCAAAPQLFVPMAIVALWDAELAVAEIERNLDRGLRAVALPEETSVLGLPSYYTEYWDPIWALCQEADIPVCMHIGSSGWKPYRPPESTGGLQIALGFVPTITHALGMMYSPVPRKFPDIKLVYSEGGIGWVPAALERADAKYRHTRYWSGDDDLLPSEVCARNMWFCVIDEPFGIRVRHDIGVDRILWECDYPHASCIWPNTQEIARALFENVPLDETEMMTFRTAEMLFKWDTVEPDELLAAGATSRSAQVADGGRAHRRPDR